MNESTETTSLRKENEELKRELKESRLHLATLAHKEYQVPDGSIRDDFQKICRAIETWIDYASSDEPGDFRNRYREALRSEDKIHKLEDLGFVFQHPANSDPWLNSLKNLDMLYYYILSLTIGRWIFKRILSKPYPVGTTTHQNDTFISIEEEMIAMGKTKSKQNQWRSDTLTALCASKSFKIHQENRLSRLWEGLGNDLSFWLESSSSSKHKSRLRRDVFDPAVKLHLDMRCSTQQFEVIGGWDVQSEPSSSGEQTLSYIVKEITTWKTMVRDGIDDFIQCIYPGLVVYDMEAKEKTELVKRVMAVHEQGVPPQVRHSTVSPVKSSTVRESRYSKHQKSTTSTPKPSSGVLRNLGLLFAGGSRKPGDNTRSPERRSSHDTSSKRTQYSPLSQDQFVSYPNLNQTAHDWHMQDSSSIHSGPHPAGESHQSYDETIEEREEPEEMSCSTSSTEGQINDHDGRATASDGT